MEAAEPLSSVQPLDACPAVSCCYFDGTKVKNVASSDVPGFLETFVEYVLALNCSKVDSIAAKM